MKKLGVRQFPQICVFDHSPGVIFLTCLSAAIMLKGGLKIVDCPLRIVICINLHITV